MFTDITTLTWFTKSVNESFLFAIVQTCWQTVSQTMFGCVEIKDGFNISLKDNSLNFDFICFMFYFYMFCISTETNGFVFM